MKILGLFFVLILWSTSLFGQSIPDLPLQDVRGLTIDLTEANEKWLLLTASEAGCSFTHTGIDQLFAEFNQQSHIQVVVLDYESEARTKEIYEDFLDAENFFFVADNSATKQAFKKNYSPQYALFNPQGQLVWKAKGLKRLNLDKVKAKMN